MGKIYIQTYQQQAFWYKNTSPQT